MKKCENIMKRAKKIVLTCAAACCLMLAAAIPCTAHAAGGVFGNQTINTEDPKTFYEQLTRAYYIDQEIETEDVWNNYVSDLSREMFTEDYFVSNEEYLRFAGILDVYVESCEFIETCSEGDIYKISYKFKNLDQGREAISPTNYEGVIKGKNGCKLLYGGQISCHYYDGLTIKNGDLEIEDICAY